MRERDEADFMPKIQDFTVQIVSTNQQADELAANGFDFRSSWLHARRSLDNGAIALCIFIGQELAHIGWIAISEKGKATVDPVPYHVDFPSKQACTGSTVTIPKYEGKGLMKYGYYRRFQFLQEKGILTSRNAVDTSNIASQKVHAKFGPRIYARAHYLRILWWQFWKETPC